MFLLLLYSLVFFWVRLKNKSTLRKWDLRTAVQIKRNGTVAKTGKRGHSRRLPDAIPPRQTNSPTAEKGWAETTRVWVPRLRNGIRDIGCLWMSRRCRRGRMDRESRSLTGRDEIRPSIVRACLWHIPKAENLRGYRGERESFRRYSVSGAKSLLSVVVAKIITTVESVLCKGNVKWHIVSKKLKDRECTLKN